MDYVCVVIHSGWGGNFAMESVATLPWNQWQLSRGIGGSFRVESVATFAWNRWQLSRGIGGNFAVEYALLLCGWTRQAADILPALGLVVIAIGVT
jgi:hypothetical protein